MKDSANVIITSSSAIALFSLFNFQNSFVGAALNAYLKENLELTRSDNVSVVSSDNFQLTLENTGFETYEFIVSTGVGENLLTVSLKSFKGKNYFLFCF